MSDFNPVSIYFILYESMGLMLWALIGLAVLLLVGIVGGILRLRWARKPPRRALVIALVAGLLTTIVFTFLVPAWTLADASALRAPIDYLFAVLFALVPGGIVGATVFVLAALKGAHGSKAAESA